MITMHSGGYCRRTKKAYNGYYFPDMLKKIYLNTATETIEATYAVSCVFQKNLFIFTYPIIKGPVSELQQKLYFSTFIY